MVGYENGLKHANYLNINEVKRIIYHNLLFYYCFAFTVNGNDPFYGQE